MEKEKISDKQAICLMILYIIGSTAVYGFGGDAKQDAWISMLIAVIFATIQAFFYARILSLYPGQNLFNINTIVFGKLPGKIFSLFFFLYAFLLGAIVIRNFSEFISIVGLTETTECIPILIIGLLCIWGVKEGVELISRFAKFIIPFVFFSHIINFIFAAKLFDVENIRPVFFNNLMPVLKGTSSTFAFPLAETVLFLCVGSCFKEGKSIYKIYTFSLWISEALLMMTMVRNIMVLGAEKLESLYFPSYTVVSLISVGDFLERFEILVSLSFIFGGFIKISICLLAATKGIASIIKVEKYRSMVAPVGFLMMNASYILYDNIMEMIEFAFKGYKYFAFPFQVILPMIIWVAAEIKTKLRKA